MKKILIIEDDLITLEFLSTIAEKYVKVLKARTLDQAFSSLKKYDLDYVFIDLDLNGKAKAGLEIIKECNNLGLKCAVITSHEDNVTVKECFHNGAESYFSKFCIEDELVRQLKKINSNQHKSFFETDYPTSDEDLKKEVIKFINNYNDNGINDIIMGETGVGKSHLVKVVHKYNQNNQPLICKNIKEISPQLLESELFGHIKGSFTGALDNREGLLQKAHGGVLFLDEIGVIPVSVQEKLLNVLENKCFSPVGSNRTIKTDFKLVTATCDNLIEKVKSGEMREDFFHRIVGHQTHIKPLRERPNDIKLHIKRIIDSSSKKVFFLDEVMNQLMSYEWRGNLRELNSYMKKTIINENGLIKSTNLSPQKKQSIPLLNDRVLESGLPSVIKEIEREAFLRANKKFSGCVNKIIKELRISKSVFYRIQKEAI